MSNEIKKKEVVYVYGYIYITTNLINNRVYIGQHKGDKLDPKYIGRCSKFIPTKEFTCPVCGQVIKNKGNLKQHLRARHPEYKLNK